MILSRDDILKADDLKTEEVDVPAWGGTVLVRELTGEQASDWQASLTKTRTAVAGPNKGKTETVPDPTNAQAKLVAVSIVDADGKLMFSRTDIAALAQKSASSLTLVSDVAMRLSGLSAEAEDEIEGNSDAVPSDGSSSTSAESSDTEPPASS